MIKVLESKKVKEKKNFYFNLFVILMTANIKRNRLVKGLLCFGSKKYCTRNKKVINYKRIRHLINTHTLDEHI